MNRRLSEQRVRNTCRELVAERGRISGRQLRQVLKGRFGAVGKTARIFRIWREETGQGAVMAPQMIEAREMQERMVAAESRAAENLARAERAEFREQAHQDHWAMEVDRLRQAGLAQAGSAATIRGLQEQVLRLTAELNAARALLLAQRT
jgi:hypothetical protein